MKQRIYVLGFGYKPFTFEEEELLLRATRVYLFSSQVEPFKERYPIFQKIWPKIRVINKLEELYLELEKTQEEVVILSTGDPLFFGLGETLLKRFPPELISIYPDLSTLQVFCAKLKIPVALVKAFSLHGRDDQQERLWQEIEFHPYLFLLTDSKNSPTYIARLLCERGLTELILHVGERLNTLEEKIYSGKPKEFSQRLFKEPNCLMIENPSWGSRLLFGLKEEEIEHRNNMITKDEVRAVILHKLGLPRRGVFWDIGAGSGAVSLEAALLSPELKVFSIEKDRHSIELILKNKKKFNLHNLEVIYGEAPYALQGLPLPHRVFLGGSGGKLEENLFFLKGLTSLERIVATFVSLKNLQKAYSILEDSHILKVTQIQVNRGKSIGGSFYLKAENPVFILQAEKGSLSPSIS